MATRNTSIEAFNKIKENGLLSKRRWQVYEYLFAHGPCTAKQVTGNLRHGLQDSGGYNTRFSELRKMGCISEIGKTTCPESGWHRATTPSCAGCQMVLLHAFTKGTPQRLALGSGNETVVGHHFVLLRRVLPNDWHSQFFRRQSSVLLRRILSNDWHFPIGAEIGSHSCAFTKGTPQRLALDVPLGLAPPQIPVLLRRVLPNDWHKIWFWPAEQRTAASIVLLRRVLPNDWHE